MRHPRQTRVALALAVLLAPVVFAPAAAAQDVPQDAEERAVKAAVAKAAVSVVRIETFGGLERVGRLLVGTGPTTGLVVSADGHVVSSAFNFAQNPTSILVTLPSGKRAAAKILARDRSRMLVLLKIDAEEELVAPQAVPASEMHVGQWAIAVGRTFGDGDRTNTSVGIISAKNRIWSKAIQTDAKISPSNYGGPLVDIQGRVLGVLVPLSPQGKDEVAGAEWYDSGIGFAIPLDDIYAHLERWKEGRDLFPGLLGITLKGNDLYATPPVIATCHVNSPAAEAGLKAGDQIVELGGEKITHIARLRHVLGHRYAGEQIRIVVLREGQRIEATVELTDKLLPYEHPFLGILPLRTTAAEKSPGVVVRHVYHESPAAKVGIQPLDRIVGLEGKPVEDADAMRDAMVTLKPGQRVKLALERGDRIVRAEAQLAALPTDIPPLLPPARELLSPDAPRQAEVGIVQINIPEESNECIAYVPTGYHPRVAHGVVVWLHASGRIDQVALIARWKESCEVHDLILLAPRSADLEKWQRMEVAFIRKALDQVMAGYNVDRSRVVVHGYQGGGVMAYLTALAHRDLVRGAAVVDAALPLMATVPENDPLQRLAVYTTTTDGSDLAERIEASAERLSQMKYPVTVKHLDGPPRYLSAEELAELVRWIDTLDRL